MKTTYFAALKQMFLSELCFIFSYYYHFYICMYVYK